MSSEIITMISAVLVAALGSPVIVLYVKAYLNRKSKVQIVNKRIENDKVILEKLYEILYKTEADRVSIFQLHPESLPMYMSCTYEVVKTGVSKEITSEQGLLMSEWNEMLIQLKENGFICIDSVDCLELTNLNLKALLKNKGVSSGYKAGIFSQNKLLRGFIAIDYINERPVPEDVKQLLTEQSVYVEKLIGEYKNV